MKVSSVVRSLATAAATLLIAGAVAAAPAQAQVYVHIGPPRPLYEVRPVRPHPGWAWRAGYHRWDGYRYVWVPGAYVMPPRPGVYWVPGHWRNTPRGWIWIEGHWR